MEGGMRREGGSGGGETERRNGGECVRREGGERGGDIWVSEVEVRRWRCEHIIIIIITRCFIIFGITIKIIIIILILQK